MVSERGLNLYIVIYRKMLKKNSFQELLGQFQPNLAGNMPGMGIQICSNKGAE